MQTPFEFMIGLTYTRQGRKGRRRDGFMSFISGISVASIALGVAALIIVLSVMNGFQKEVRDRMLSVIPHIEVTAVPGPLRDSQRSLKPGATSLPQRLTCRGRGFLIPAPSSAARS